MEATSSRQEAELFGRYLLGRGPNERSILLYEDALKKMNITSEGKDMKILLYIFSHPWSLKYLDAGLALFRRESPVRRKICLMLAILETSPEYSRYFLTEKRSLFYLIYILWVCLSAGFKASIGALILKFI